MKRATLFLICFAILLGIISCKPVSPNPGEIAEPEQEISNPNPENPPAEEQDEKPSKTDKEEPSDVAPEDPEEEKEPIQDQPAPSLPQDDLNFWLSPGKETARPISAIQWHQNEKDGTYDLFLPSESKLSRMQVWFSGAELCKIDDKSLQNGQEITFLKEKNYTLTLGEQIYPIRIMKSKNIGSMYITTESGSMDYIHAEKGNKETGALRYVNADGKTVYSGELKEIKGRGNATWNKPKKPYQIKLQDKTEMVKDAGVSGTWLLLANYAEKTMVHNTVAYNLAYDIGLTETTRSEFTDLYCNGIYMGTYQLCEKVQIAENRLEITDLEKATEKVNDKALDTYPVFGEKKAVKSSSKGIEIPNDPEDITGGYLLEIEKNDRYPNEPSGFVTKRGTAVVIKEPEYASRAQVTYISNYFQEFEDAVYSKDGICPSTGKRFDEYFDLTSLAKKYVLEEFIKNIDADNTSQFYYKPSDSESKVGFCGPAWDYDNAFDVMTTGDDTDGLYAATRKKRIYNHLINHDFFMDEVKKQWKEQYLPAIAVVLGEKKPAKDDSLRPLSDYYKLLTPSAAMNYTLWGNIDIPINQKHIYTGKNYQEHFDYLKSFIKDRRAELNKIWLNE